MSEMRWNPMMGEWVATATHRQDRTYKPPKGFCPLCPTKQGGFPTEVPSDNYEMVVFENKFPSFRRQPFEPDVEGTELYPVKSSQGICEVVLYSPRHEGSLTDYPVSHIRKLIEVWTDRYLELGARDFIKYVFIFENKGEVVGVTLAHPHGQIYAFSFIPPRVQAEIDAARAHREKHGTCVLCDVVAAERKAGARIVMENDHFLAVVPFYARYPYEVHILAREHRSSLADLNDAEKMGLAEVLKAVMVKYDNLFDMSFPYMMVMHQAPTTGDPGAADFHFHIEFYPPLRSKDKQKFLAGCESGAGQFVNDSCPEEKAEELRNAAPHSLEEVRNA